MTAYYKGLMELWEAGNFSDAIRYFSRSISKGSLVQEEIEDFKLELGKFWELLEVESEENREVIFTLYDMLKKARDWDDETLSKKLKISEKAIEDIKNRHKQRSEGVGLKMLHELFPKMAV